MFDYLRNLTKSAEEKQQEAMNAYLDDALSAQERRQFEKLLADNVDLRQEVEQRQALQAQMRQMPRRRVPRNFALDPAVYGRPQRQPLFQLYPAMRVAAVLTAFFFILAIGSEIFLTGQGGMAEMSNAPAQDVAMMADEVVEEAAEETAVELPLAAPAAEVVEVTRVVTETVVEEGEAVESMSEEEMADAAEMVTEEEAMPSAEEPALQSDATEDDATYAVGGTETGVMATVLPPTPSPAPTLTASAAIDATKSTVPRPEAATETGERAFPTAQPQLLDEAVVIEPTAVPPPPFTPSPVSGLRLLQIGLGLLLILLVTAVIYVRRQTF